MSGASGKPAPAPGQAAAKASSGLNPVVMEKQDRAAFDPNKQYSFEEENERDLAARRIQRNFRSYNARSYLRTLIRSNYVKLVDRETGLYIYKNKMTGETTFRKPLCLGAFDLDLPHTPKAPEDYEVGYMEGMPEGWFLGVICKSFPRSGGRLADMNRKIDAEKEALMELVPHDFICRFRPENVTFIEDPRASELLDSIERLSRVCTKKGFFVLYLCTHVLTVVKGEPKTNPKETAYFATKETVWGKPEEIASSSMSLTALCKQVQKLPCKRKTVILNYAHMQPPKKSVFASVRSVYPPSDVLSRLADTADCAVIASCVTGATMSETLSHMPSLASNKATKKNNKKASAEGSSLAADEADAKAGKKNDDSDVGESSGAEDSSSFPSEQQRPDSAGDDKLVHSDYTDQTKDGEEGDDEDGEGHRHRHHVHEDSAEEFFRMLDGKDHSHDGENSLSNLLLSAYKSRRSSATAWSKAMEKLVADWKVPPEEELKPSPKPPPLRADWSKDAATGAFNIKLPTSLERWNNRIDTAIWRVKRALGPPTNFIREQIRSLKKRVMSGPCQTSQLGSTSQEPMLIFGSALTDGLRGGAHRPTKRTVTAQMLFHHIEESMRASCKKLYEDALAAALLKAEAETKEANDNRKYPDKEPEILVDRDAVARSVNPADFNQNPLLFVPRNNAKAAKNPICIRCGPPAAPDKPFVVRTGTNEVLLEWYFPEFEGVKPRMYQIEMRNNSRVFNSWKPINYTPEIRLTRFLVRDLPSGVACRFRVSAFNNGGWSRDSKETGNVIPGEELTPLQTAGRWRKIGLGGPMAILDKMRLGPLDRLENILGLKRLSAFAQKGNGFAKGSVQLKAAAAALTALDTFEDDVQIISAALSLIGWTLFGGPGADRVRVLLDRNNFAGLAEGYMERFRMDSAIINAAAFARSSYSAIPCTPEFVPTPDEDDEKKEESEDLGTDSEEENEEVKKKKKKKAEEAKKPKHNLNDARCAVGSYLYFNMARIPDHMRPPPKKSEEEKHDESKAEAEALAVDEAAEAAREEDKEKARQKKARSKAFMDKALSDQEKKKNSRR